jgi:hypothetical protein
MLMLFCMVASPTSSDAAFGVGDVVFDPSNFQQNLATAVQSLQMVSLMTKDLAPIREVGAFLQTVTIAQHLGSQIREIGGRMLGRTQWWNEQRVPESLQELVIFRHQAMDVCSQTHMDALGIQGLIDDLLQMMETLNHLMGNIQSLLGSVSNLQQVNAALGVAAHHIGTLAAMSAGEHESAICERTKENLEARAVGAVINEQMRNWGQP